MERSDQETYAPQVTKLLDLLAAKYPSEPSCVLGDILELECETPFLPSHKEAGLEWCKADSWTALRGSEGEAEMLSVLRKGSRVEVVEVVEEDESSFDLEKPYFKSIKGICNGVERPQTPDEEKSRLADAFVPTREKIKDRKAMRYFKQKYNPDYTKSFAIHVGPESERYIQRVSDPIPHLFVSLKDPIKTVYVKVVVLKAKKFEKEEVSYDPLGLPVRCPRYTFPVASKEDLTGGYLETEGVEGWIAYGKVLRHPVETDFVKMFGNPPDEAKDEYFDFKKLSWRQKINNREERSSSELSLYLKK